MFANLDPISIRLVLVWLRRSMPLVTVILLTVSVLASTAPVRAMPVETDLRQDQTADADQSGPCMIESVSLYAYSHVYGWYFRDDLSGAVVEQHNPKESHFNTDSTNGSISSSSAGGGNRWKGSSKVEGSFSVTLSQEETVVAGDFVGDTMLNGSLYNLAYQTSEDAAAALEYRYVITLMAATDVELLFESQISEHTPSPQSQSPASVITETISLSSGQSHAFDTPNFDDTAGWAPYVMMGKKVSAGGEYGSWTGLAYADNVTEKFTIRCVPKSSLTVEIEPTSTVLCKDEGFVLPAKVKVTNESGQSISDIDIDVTMSDIGGGTRGTIAQLGAFSSTTLDMDIDVGSFVQDSDGALESLKLKAVASADSQNATAEVTVPKLSLDDPEQFVRDAFRGMEKKSENEYTAEQGGIVLTNNRRTIAARFAPFCGSGKLPLATLAAELNVKHINWLQTVTFPSNWSVYTVSASDFNRIGVSCKRLGETENALLYTDTELPVAKRSMDRPHYDPPIADSGGGQHYLFGIDGPDEDDICWTAWAIGGTDEFKPYLTSQERASATRSDGFYFSDSPEQEKWTLMYDAKDGKTNQYIRFDTRLVGVTANEEVIPGKVYDGFTWKSNTVISGGGGVFLPGYVFSNRSRAAAEEVEGGIFDIGRIEEVKYSIHLPLVMK